MLTLPIPRTELFDEGKKEFIHVEPTILALEHSLLSLAKWESKWNKPFLGAAEKTYGECLDYVRCMTLNETVDPLVYKCLTKAHFDLVNAYIEAPMTATTIKERSGRKNSREVITSELIYYWMTALNIPFSCETWHLNRLLMLIRVCDIKSSPQKKLSQKDVYSQNRTLNAERRKMLGTKG